MKKEEMLSFLDYATKIQYSDIQKMDKKLLMEYIKTTTDTYKIELIFHAVVGNDNELTTACIERSPYLAGNIYEEDVLKDLKYYKKIAAKYPKEVVTTMAMFDDSILDRMPKELFIALEYKPLSIRYLSDVIMIKHHDRVMNVFAKKPAIIRFLPKEVLIKHSDEVMNFFKIDNRLLEFMPAEIQVRYADEIKEIVKKNPAIYIYLDIRCRDKELFYTSIEKLFPTLTKEQRDIAYEFSLNNDYLLSVLEPFMLDDKIIKTLGVKVVERLLRYKDVVEAIGKIHNDTNKLNIFLELIKLYDGKSYIEPRIEYICNTLLKNEVTFVRMDRVPTAYLSTFPVKESSEPIYDVEYVELNRLDDYISEKLRNGKLTDIERKRIAYLYFKNKGRIVVDNPDDFEHLDEFRLKKLQEKVTDPELTVREAKNVIFELKYGFSVDEAQELLNKYSLEIHELLNDLDKTNLTIEEVEAKGALLTLLQIKRYNEIIDIELLREEIENAFVNYKGEEAVYDSFLYLEDSLRKIFNDSMTKTVNEDLVLIDEDFVPYESIVPLEFQRQEYVGKLVKITRIDPECDFNILVSVNDGYRSSRDHSEPTNMRDKWMNPEFNSNHAICTSEISNRCLGTAPITYTDGLRKNVYRFKIDDSRAITAAAPFDLASNSNNNTTVAMRSSVYLTGKKNIEYTRHTHNEVVVELDEVKGEFFRKRIPESIICFETVNPRAVEAAIDFGIDINVIDRVAIAKYQREKIHEAFLDFLKFVIGGDRQYKMCLNEMVTLFGSMRAGFRNSDLKNVMVEDKDALFNPGVLNAYFAELFIKINELVNSGELERVKEIIETIKAALSLEESKIFLLKNDHGRQNTLPYDKRFVMRELDKIERKGLIKTFTQVDSVQTLDNLDKNLADADHYYNMYWRAYQGHYAPEEVIGDVDQEFIRNNIDSIYRSGLYSDFSGHDVSHIERVAVLSSIIAKKIGLSEDVRQLAILAAIYHDSGRITEGHEKHGDYSAAIFRSMMGNSLSKEDVNLVCAAIDLHDEEKEDIETISQMMIRYRVKDRIKLTALMSVLKDADALDRVRFLNSKSGLDTKYLRFEESKKLIRFATELYEIEVLRKLRILYDKHFVSKNELDTYLNSKRLPEEILFEVLKKNNLDINCPIFYPTKSDMPKVG